jgi:tetratricopeptide (TPR) repeat protein
MLDAAAELAQRPEGQRLVGRRRELAVIAGALADAEALRGRLVLVCGEPGIGKTTLADAATAMAAERHFRVYWGRCWESGGAPAYFPWLGVLSGLAAGLDEETLAEVLGDGASVLAEILPELRRRLPPPSTGAQPPAEEARFRVFRAIVALAREVSQRAGLVLVLDDLHAADRSSLALLHFFARELRGSKLLVLGTYRDAEARADTELGELISRIGREGTLISLARLSEDEAQALVSAHTELSSLDSGHILARAQGNPLFLEEMLRLYAEQGAESIEAGIVPHGVRDVIGQRLSRVSPEARSLLELAAVGGDELEPSLLALAAGGDADAVTRALGEATLAGVLTERGERRRFAHALFREVLYRDLAPAARQELHGRLARALERAASSASLFPHDKVAHHAFHGPEDLLEPGVRHALAAARRAQELLAYDEAIQVLERALAAVTGRGNRTDLRARVLVALGEAAIRRGDGALGKRCCSEAASLAKGLGDAELAANAALVYGRVFLFGSVDPVLIGMLEASLEALPAGDSALRARLLGRLAAALQPSVNVDEPIAIALDAIQTARRLGDKQTLLDVMHDSISAITDCAGPAGILALNLEAESLAREVGDRERLLTTYGRLFFLHLSMGELELADARASAYEALARELAAPWIGYRTHFFRAVRATMHGRFAETEAALSEALRLGTEAGDPAAPMLYASGREALFRASERYDELLVPHSMARRERGYARFAQAWLVFHAGLAHARREDAEHAARAYELMPSAYPMNLFSYFFVAEMVAVGGTDEAAERLLKLVSDSDGPYLTLAWSYAAWDGPRARLLALLYGRLRRYEEASASFEESIAGMQKLDTGPYLARTQYEYGRMLAERGQAGDAARAHELFTKAHERASALGMPGLIAHIERRLAALSVKPSSPPPARPAPTLRASPFTMTLEGEYFSLGYQEEVVRFKAGLGLHYLARLVEAPGREVHVLDLVRAQGGSDASELADTGDAGELLDETARERYRQRAEELRDELAEAEANADAGRAERAREELEFLGRELGRAVGLGGRARRAGVAAERARSAVQRRIRHAIERIGTQRPALANFLSRSVRTGIYCSFVPVPE